MAPTLLEFLTLYLWFPLTALLGFMLLIARFYEKYSDHRTHYRLFLVPVVLYGGALVRYAGVDQLGHDPLADVLLGAGGAVFLILSLRLYRLMVR
ncbi:MAG: hypothetical protein OHK0046_30220 [Anaerolineae bacterium]